MVQPCSLLTAYCLLLTVDGAAVLTAYYSLLTACCLLLTVDVVDVLAVTEEQLLLERLMGDNQGTGGPREQ